ncbi:MAG TPA: DUF3048 domain-containing protein [Acidimicrobiales bacterium]|nr:DUF3048 domain-containing protein [Acidimicrobiales bacterium]
MRKRPGAPIRLLATTAAAVVVMAAACGGGGGGGETADETRPETTTTTTPVPAPLTGVILTDGNVAKRPAINIKIDNGPQGRPQAGIDKADVLIEEKVEGGITRFVAVFHSEDADPVGPVRSVRSTDIALVTAIGGVFVFAGGIPEFERQARALPLTVVSESVSADGFKYPADKRRPYKTYTDTATLRSMAKDHDEPPPALFDFLGTGEVFNPAGVVPATSADVPYGRTAFKVEFDVASNTWKRSTDGRPHATAGGGQLAFANVIIQRTSYRPTPFKDPAGSVVDEAVVVGSGDAVILSQGRQVPARWTKPSANAVTTYTDAVGNPIKLTPGRTLIALPPADAAISVT